MHLAERGPLTGRYHWPRAYTCKNTKMPLKGEGLNRLYRRENVVMEQEEEVVVLIQAACIFQSQPTQPQVLGSQRLLRLGLRSGRQGTSLDAQAD